jgi:hypothetical protein
MRRAALADAARRRLRRRRRRKAEELATEVLADGAARWKLATTMSDLEATVLLVQDPDTKTA